MPRPLLVCCFAVLLAGPPARAADPVDAAALQEQMKKLIDRAETSVVALVISNSEKHVTDKKAPAWSLGKYEPNAVAFSVRGNRDKLDLSDPHNAGEYLVGSGVVLDAEAGLVLTCFHLIDGAKKIYARGPGEAGSYADIVAGDARSDLAVLKLLNPVSKLTAARFAAVRTHDTPKAKATVTRGQWVVSLGHPFGIGFADGKASASWGLVSNVGRKTSSPPGADEGRAGYLYQYSSLLQTDARLNLGCSGGGLFNLDGDLIGLTSAAAGVAGSESAGGFAVPMDAIYRGIVDALKTGQEVEYGFLGVGPGIAPAGPRRGGLSVQTVTPGSPAEDADIRPNDVIEAVNGRPIAEETDLFLLVGGALARHSVTLSVARGERRKEVSATLTKFRHTYTTIASVAPLPVHGLRVEYRSILAQAGRGPGVPAQLAWNGVIVQEVQPNTPAEAAFKAKGIAPEQWLITRVNGKAVTTPAAFYAAATATQTVSLTMEDSTGARKVVLLP